MAEKYLYEYMTGDTSVQFTMSPNNNSGSGEIGTVSVGDIIYVSGRVRNTSAKINTLELRMVTSGLSIVSNVVTISNVARDTWRKFSANFTINDTLSARNTKIYLGIRVNGGYNSYYDIHNYAFYSYYVEPRVTSLILQRCDGSGNLYNEGAYLKCTELRIGIGDRASYSDITQMRVSTSPSVYSNTYSGSTLSSITQSAVSSYYSDGSPTSSSALLGGTAFSTETDYDITIELTAGSETSTYRTSVSRSFAKLHIAGNPSGGVAVGMFSTSDTDGQPKFEVASSHDTYFKGPVYFEQPVEFQSSVSGLQSSGNSYSSGEQSTGKTWITGRAIYRYVLTGSLQVTGTADKTTLFSGLPTMNTVISMVGSVTCDGVVYNLANVSKGSDVANVSVRLEPSEAGGGMSVVMVTGSAVSGMVNYVVIIEYTKS